MTKLEDAISVIKKYEELIMPQNKKIIELLLKQGCILKQFKNTENFSKTLGISRSTVYFK